LPGVLEQPHFFYFFDFFDFAVKKITGEEGPDPLVQPGTAKNLVKTFCGAGALALRLNSYTNSSENQSFFYHLVI
jgi:hypothetical protein